MVPYFRFPKEAPRLPTAEELAALHAWALIEDGAPSYAGCPAIVELCRGYSGAAAASIERAFTVARRCAADCRRSQSHRGRMFTPRLSQ